MIPLLCWTFISGYSRNREEVVLIKSVHSSHSRQQHPRRWRINVQALQPHTFFLRPIRGDNRRGQGNHYTPRKDQTKTTPIPFLRHTPSSTSPRVPASCISQLYNFSSFLFKERGNLWAFKERDRKKCLFLQFISSIPSSFANTNKNTSKTHGINTLQRGCVICKTHGL